VNFQKGDLNAKKEILAALGSNPTLKDGKLVINTNEWFIPIINECSELEAEYKRLEPIESLVNKTQNEAYASLRTRLSRERDSNPRRHKPLGLQPSTIDRSVIPGNPDKSGKF
jgi:hypothetical protein